MPVAEVLVAVEVVAVVVVVDVVVMPVDVNTIRLVVSAVFVVPVAEVMVAVDVVVVPVAEVVETLEVAGSSNGRSGTGWCRGSCSRCGSRWGL